jgi:hypothetical protein
MNVASAGATPLTGCPGTSVTFRHSPPKRSCCGVSAPSTRDPTRSRASPIASGASLNTRRTRDRCCARSRCHQFSRSCSTLSASAHVRGASLRGSRARWRSSRTFCSSQRSGRTFTRPVTATFASLRPITTNASAASSGSLYSGRGRSSIGSGAPQASFKSPSSAIQRCRENVAASTRTGVCIARRRVRSERRDHTAGTAHTSSTTASRSMSEIPSAVTLPNL